MYTFTEIMQRIKEQLNLHSDTQLAEKLGITRSNYSEKKRNNSIPYENLLILCKENNLSIDYLLNNQKKSEKLNNFKKLLINSIENLDEENCKYFYHLVELEIIKNERLK